ncbi:MAG: hypothetical protein AB1445_14450 [Bacillota bacterium]
MAAIIIPVYLETTAVREQLEALSTLDGIITPAQPDPAMPSTTKDIQPLPPPADRPATEPVTQDDDFRQRLLAYHDELRTIMAQGYAGQLAVAKQSLETMGVPFKYYDEGFSLTATLTAAQIEEIAALPEVASIQKEIHFEMDIATTELGVPKAAAPPVDAGRSMAVADAAGTPGASPSPSWYLLVLVLIPRAVVLLRRR